MAKKVIYADDDVKYTARDRKMDSVGVPINANTAKRRRSWWSEFWDWVVVIATI
jgi:hypothetical protein